VFFGLFLEFKQTDEVTSNTVYNKMRYIKNTSYSSLNIQIQHEIVNSPIST